LQYFNVLSDINTLRHLGIPAGTEPSVGAGYHPSIRL